MRSAYERPANGLAVTKNPAILPSYLDLRAFASQTRDMAHTYILFDFGADEEAAQKARHKLEGWKQAFRLDKKLQIKFDRGEGSVPEAADESDKPEKPKSHAKAKGKSKTEDSGAATAGNGTVKLLVRLYFSAHEKLSEQQWLARIPAEELFKGASPKVVHEGEKEFPEVLKQFDSLE